MSNQTRTFQTRIDGEQPALAATEGLFSCVARRVDAALARVEAARTVARTMWPRHVPRDGTDAERTRRGPEACMVGLGTDRGGLESGA